MAGRPAVLGQKAKLVLLGCYCYCCYLVRASDVILYDTMGHLDLNFEVYPDGSWTPNTYNNNTDILPSMTVCAIDRSGNVSNWFRMPFVKAAGIDTLYVSLQFAMRDCIDFPNVVKQCKQVFGLLKTEAPEAAIPQWDLSTSGYSLVQNIAADSTYRGDPLMTVVNTKVVQVSKDSRSAGVHFAFHDEGACVQIIRIVVYRKQCDRLVSGLAAFDDTAAAATPRLATGRCVANAAIAGSLMMYCATSGDWLPAAGPACTCTAGYEPSSDNKSCSGCPIQTYRSSTSMPRCLGCPARSRATSTGSQYCACDSGYYRADGEDVSLACTGPPSQVLSLNGSADRPEQVLLTWLQPNDTGGRTDIFYSVSCASCPQSVGYAPAQSHLTATRVTVFGLAPGSKYTFSVFAMNGVSNKVMAVTQPASVTITTFSNLGSVTPEPATIAVTAQVLNSTSITLSWTADSSADVYTLLYYPHGLPSQLLTANFTSNAGTIGGLQAATTYHFRVSSYSGGQLLSSSPEVLFSTAPAPAAASYGSDSPTPTTVIIVAVIAVLIGMGVVFGIVVIVMVTLARRSSSDQSDRCTSCASLYKLLNSMFLSKPACCGKMKQAAGCASQPWRTSSSATTAATAAVNASAEQSLPPSPLSPCTPVDITSAAPLFSPSAGGSVRRGRSGKTYVDPHTYEDPTNAVREFARELDASCIIIESVIGGGEFGDVCRGVLRVPSAPDTIVAIKTLKGGASEKSRLDFLTEASIMGQFDDPNIIFLEGVVTKTNPIMIVTEFMENGSLDTFLRANDGSLSLTQLVGMLRGIASGMRYLADMSYVHRDLAARNILVSSTLVCKVADFGLSREVEYNESEGAYTTRGGKIPVRWTAPEAIAYRKFTTASDVWSYGVVMWEVMSFGERPYWNWSNQDVIKAVEQNYRLPAPMDCPEAIHQLMLNCWHRERSARPKFTSIVQVLDKLSRSKDLLQASVVGTSQPSADTSGIRIQLQDRQASWQDTALHSWLSAIGMDCYFLLFTAHGYSTVERVVTLTSAILEGMGIVQAAHRNRILNSVQLLGGGQAAAARTIESVPPSMGFLV